VYVIFIIWVLIVISALLTLLGSLDKGGKWIQSFKISCISFIIYSAFVIIAMLGKLIWNHLPGG